jgi:hypothetical protein
MLRYVFNILNNGTSSTAFTIFGWTPGLHALVSGRLLACGCLAGLYRTWGGGMMIIVDSRGDACTHPDHAVNRVLWRQPGSGGQHDLEHGAAVVVGGNGAAVAFHDRLDD